MDASRENMALISGVLISLFGLYGLAVGRIRYGPGEGSGADDRELTGLRARLVSAVAVIAGVSFFFSPAVGLLLIVAVISMTWLIGP